MSRRTLYILGVLILMGLSAAAGVLGYVYFVGGSGQASQPISAATLDPSTSTLTSTLFRISQDESEVSFEIDEVLMGQPKHVIGTTNQVAGDIFVDYATPTNTKVGEIRIDARTLSTDSELRNRALRSQILQSSRDEYEFISFTPTTITGLPDKIEVGQEVTFQVTGDLKIREITQPITFDVTATATTGDRLEGSAKADVTRDQFGLTIPNAPGVANVTNEVILNIKFVALKVAT
jgi:polyisoprenoid-binding protein YceI